MHLLWRLLKGKQNIVKLTLSPRLGNWRSKEICDAQPTWLYTLKGISLCKTCSLQSVGQTTIKPWNYENCSKFLFHLILLREKVSQWGEWLGMSGSCCNNPRDKHHRGYSMCQVVLQRAMVLQRRQYPSRLRVHTTFCKITAHVKDPMSTFRPELA